MLLPIHHAMSPRTHGRVASVRYSTILALVVLASAAACTPSGLDSTRTTSGNSRQAVRRTSGGDRARTTTSSSTRRSRSDRSHVDCATIDVPAIYGRDSGLPDFGLAMMLECGRRVTPRSSARFS